MAQPDAYVDAAAVHALANRFEESAHLLDGATRTHFARMAFDGTTSGRAYIGQGDALRFAVHRLGGELAQWARASLEVAAALRASADRYDEAERLAAARIA